ncbi:MAG TPA: TspO/MBR family protein [Methylomirabilota bacterium]|nr:TspO/MBR family protein [Methylomirabilota bacterium]
MDAAIPARTLAHRDRPRAIPILAASAAICLGAAAVGSLATRPEIEGWYRSIEKPWFNPPDWIFGPVWTVLFIVMAGVLWQIWRTPVVTAVEIAARRRALTAFAVQLVLNVGWSVVFFGLNSIAGGMVVVVLLWLAILWTIVAARPVIGEAAWWLAPYVGWVFFAGILNAAILSLNG